MKLKEFAKEASSDQVNQILEAETADALLALAKKFNVVLSQEEAEVLAEANIKHQDEKNTGELLDHELEAVSGGSRGENGSPKSVYCYDTCDSFSRDKNAFGPEPICKYCKHAANPNHIPNVLCTL